jgi:hypothetical protein
MHHPDTLPVAFIKNSYFITNRQVHNYPTRDNTDLHLPNSCTNFGSRNTKFKAARLWNELPQFLKDPLSIQTFKNISQEFLLLNCRCFVGYCQFIDMHCAHCLSVFYLFHHTII